MGIRRYLTVTITISLLFIGIISFISYRKSFELKKRNASAMENQNGISRLARVNKDVIEIYAGGIWQDFDMRGIHLSSFYPGYERFHSNVDKKDVLAWLEMIADLGANTIYVPYLQPPNFYSAIYDYNLNRLYPLYILQSIPIDLKSAMGFHNTQQPDIAAGILANMRDIIDAMHGKAIVFDNNGRHSGVYLDDISAYVLGYIAGSDTSAEAVA